VLPLHFASRLGQVQLGALYVGAAVVVAVTSAAAGSMAPARALAGAGVLIVAGIGLAGMVSSAALFVVALGLAGAGIGLGQTGATGILLGTVAPERIVTAMVLWSQLGIVGYLAGPVAGGAVAQALGFQAVGLVPLAGVILLLAVARRAIRSAV
jgi:MFS family permease